MGLEKYDDRLSGMQIELSDPLGHSIIATLASIDRERRQLNVWVPDSEAPGGMRLIAIEGDDIIRVVADGEEL